MSPWKDVSRHIVTLSENQNWPHIILTVALLLCSPPVIAGREAYDPGVLQELARLTEDTYQDDTRPGVHNSRGFLQ